MNKLEVWQEYLAAASSPGELAVRVKNLNDVFQRTGELLHSLGLIEEKMDGPNPDFSSEIAKLRSSLWGFGFDIEYHRKEKK